MLAGALLGLGAGALLEGHGSQHAVLHDVHVVEEVEALEHHADGLAQAVDVDVLGGQVLAVEPHVAGVGGLEQVNAAQQGGLAGAGGADDGDDLARHDLEVHAAQDVVCAKGLLNALDANDRLGSVSHVLLLNFLMSLR